MNNSRGQKVRCLSYLCWVCMLTWTLPASGTGVAAMATNVTAGQALPQVEQCDYCMSCSVKNASQEPAAGGFPAALSGLLAPLSSRQALQHQGRHVSSHFRRTSADRSHSGSGSDSSSGRSSGDGNVTPQAPLSQAKLVQQLHSMADGNMELALQLAPHVQPSNPGGQPTAGSKPSKPTPDRQRQSSQAASLLGAPASSIATPALQHNPQHSPHAQCGLLSTLATVAVRWLQRLRAQPGGRSLQASSRPLQASSNSLQASSTPLQASSSPLQASSSPTSRSPARDAGAAPVVEHEQPQPHRVRVYIGKRHGPGHGGRAARGHWTRVDGGGSGQGHNSTLMTLVKLQARVGLPNCTACTGCQHQLQPMPKNFSMLGSEYTLEVGNSPGWLFKVRSSRTPSGFAIVKLWCVPVNKMLEVLPRARCNPPELVRTVKLLRAQQMVAEECGLAEVVPTMWIDGVNAVLPGLGFHVDWPGMWAEIAEGVSVENLAYGGLPATNKTVLLDLFTNKINHTQVELGAIHDLLFSQCDRHPQNVIVNADGSLKLIDNDQAFRSSWRRCAMDSLFLPTTQKFYINSLGFGYVMKYPMEEPPKAPTKHPSPLVLLDYRCHVAGGAIGTRFSPKLQRCLKKVDAMSKEDIQGAYGYPDIEQARALKSRARDLLARGFEWTLENGWPQNPAAQHYKPQSKCCKMALGRSNSSATAYSCVDLGYQPTHDIPYGNPTHGGKWHGPPGKDTGTYMGGNSAATTA